MNLLITSVSAKLGLVQAFKESLAPYGGKVVGIDASGDVPAALECDAFYTVPATTDPEFEKRLDDICLRESIGLIVPTREEELPWWAEWGEESDIHVAVSSLACLDICLDKLKAYQWLSERGLPTPLTLTAEAAMKSAQSLSFPMIAKDPLGSGSRNISMLQSLDDLSKVDAHWIVQPFLSGQEYTINLYVDRNGACRVVVPHRRDKVVGGEVSRAEVVDTPILTELGQRLAGALPDHYGPLNFQVFIDETGSNPLITDINPRFGGGYLLCHAAGGVFTQWLIQEAANQRLTEGTISVKIGLKLDRNQTPQCYF